MTTLASAGHEATHPTYSEDFNDKGQKYKTKSSKSIFHITNYAKMLNNTTLAMSITAQQCDKTSCFQRKQ